MDDDALSPPPGTDTPPLSVARVRRVLGARQIDYVTAESGDTGLESESGDIWIRVAGADDAVLRITADWPGAYDVEKVEAVRGFLRSWHRQHYWPKATFGITDDGLVTVHAAVHYDFESGVADRQLDAVMAMSVVKIREMFRQVAAL